MSLFFLLGFFTVLFLVLAFLLLFVIRQKKVLKKKLKESDFFLENLIEGEKNERKKIAIELHDKLQGDLIAIRNFNFIVKQHKDENEKQSLLMNIDVTIEAAIKNTRRLSHKLRPPMLDKSDFVNLVEDYFKTISLLTGKHFQIKYNAFDFFLPKEKVYESLRIIQVFCDFIVDQGTATALYLTYHQDEKKYYIEISDNGNAINIADHYLIASDIGLRTLPARLKVLDAELIQKEVTDGNHFILNINKKA